MKRVIFFTIIALAALLAGFSNAQQQPERARPQAAPELTDLQGRASEAGKDAAMMEELKRAVQVTLQTIAEDKAFAATLLTIAQGRRVEPTARASAIEVLNRMLKQKKGYPENVSISNIVMQGRLIEIHFKRCKVKKHPDGTTEEVCWEVVIRI